jgi:metal-responsive CopG/Arc/MetJ family transcriptional regulator
MAPKYVGINIPVNLAEVLDEIVKKEKIYGTRAALAKHILQDWIEEYRKENKRQQS